MRVANERNRNPTNALPALRAPAALGALLVTAALSLVACKDFSFFTELGYKGGLSISPRTVEVVAGGTVQFTASSGVEPYSYSIVVSLEDPAGRIDASGLYQAPAVIGPETVVVQDAVGTTAPAYITVVAAAGSIPDYRVQASPAWPAAGTGGAGFTGSFVIENIGDNGASDVTWNLYISANDTYGTGDILADSGTHGFLGAGGSSASIGFDGTWPAAGTPYYLILVLAAADDPNTSNNSRASGAIPISPSSLPPDYEMLSVEPLAAAPATGGTAFGPYNITFQNNGGGHGTATLTWEVYLSADLTIGGGDQLVGTGTVAAAGLTVGTPITRSFSGTWPTVSSPLTRYFVARVSAVDEQDVLPNTEASAAITIDVLDVEYQVPAGTVTIPGAATAGAGTGLQSFDIHNYGSQTGTASISWEVYASPGNQTLGDAGDVLLAAGSRAAVAAGATQNVTYSGTWPNAAGTAYYLVARISSGDDRNGGNNTRGSASSVTLAAPPAADVDYGGSIAAPSALRAGAAFTSSITITNNGTDPGAQTVYYAVYASKDDTSIDYGTDKLVGSGSFAPLGPSPASTTKSFTSSWPAARGTYYLLAEILADDDDTPDNDHPVAGSYIVGITDYSGTVTWNSGSASGGPFDGTLIVQNWNDTEAVAGVATIYWSVYASKNDTVIGTGDKLVGSGSIVGGLGVGASSLPQPINNTWPNETGAYYLVADIQASDDANTANNRPSSGQVILNGVDYTGTVSFGSGTTATRGFDGTVNIMNAGGSAGVADLYYTVYASLGNDTIDLEDKVVASGMFAGGLGAGISTGGIGFSNTWPAAPGSYFLILDIAAADDVDPLDNQDSVSVGMVTAPVVDYVVDTLNVTGPAVMIPGQAVDGQFVYKNSGSTDGDPTKGVSWEVYASTNNTLDVSDSLVASGGGQPALGSGAVSAPVMFSGPWPLDYGNYFLIAVVHNVEETGAATGNNTRATGAATPVGFFNEAAHEPNNDYLTLTNPYDLGAVMRPGMSIQITGTMAGTDMDDIMAFNTGACTMITFAVTYGSAKSQIRIFLMDGPNSFIEGVSGTAGAISDNWTPDAAGAVRYLNLDNRGDTPAWNGPYTCVITGH